MKIFLLTLFNEEIYWYDLEIWMHENTLHLGIWPFAEATKDLENYNQFFEENVELMMQDIYEYEINWSNDIETIEKELIQKQYLIQFEDNLIAIHDHENTDIDKIDLFLDIYNTEIFKIKN